MINNLSLLRRFAVVLLASCFALHAFPQDKSRYSLLWRISGNGLSKPSYLFGTMHVKDKRVFNFSDSVMLCLQKCNRFALEVHPDTVISKMFAMLQNTDSLHTIDKLLDTGQYKKLAKKFMDKNGYPMGKTNPMLLESLMKPDDTKPDDKVSFIDVYLYGIARTLNKEILGLEDASTQFDEYFGAGDALKERLLDLLDDGAAAEKDEAKEELIKIYSTGDLEAIYKYAWENGLLDSAINARNKVMARSMIKYMTDEPLFTAIGAAHLPGQDGVIALLRKAGYNVTQVKAPFTGLAESYRIDYLKMKWPEYRDDKQGYLLSFPGAPGRNKLFGRDNVIYPDMANDLYYGIYAVPKGTADEPAKQKEVVEEAVSLLSKTHGNTIISRKDLLYDKTPCTELLLKNNNGYMRLRMVFANNLLYTYYVGSKHNRLAQPYIDRFFNSFTYFPIAPKIAAPWIAYTNTAGAFTIKFPVEPQVITKDIPSRVQTKQVTFKLNMYLSTDTANSKSYLVRYNDYPAGTFLSDKTALFNSLASEFGTKGKIIGGPVKIWKDGYEGRELNIILTGGYNAILRLFARGNRVYILLNEIIQPNLKHNGKDPFFDSFQFTPYAEPGYYTLQPDSNFKIRMPSKPEVLPDTSKEYTSYLTNNVVCFSTNPNSGGLYGFEYSKINPYFRIDNVDSLYKKLTAGVTGAQDSLLKVDTVLMSGLKGRELLTIKKETNSRKRVRVLIDGENVFFLSTHADSTELFSQTANTFYNSFVIIHPSGKIDLASSKAGTICRDLRSADTLVFKKAHGALSFYTFTKSELPYIYAAISRGYPDDTANSGGRRKLIEQLKTVSDDSTINVLTRVYEKSNGKDDLKGGILNAIPIIDKKRGYDIYLKLLKTDPPLKLKEPYEIFSALRDSVEYAARHFEQVLPFVKYDDYRDQVLRLANSITNQKDTSYNKVVRKNYLALMSYAQADIEKYVSQADSNKTLFNSRMYNYMQLIGKIKFKDFNDKLTKGYLEKDPKGLYVPEATVARINNNLPNNPLVVAKLLDSIGTRYDIMDAYNNMQQLYKVPLKYRTQQAYAKLCLYQSISVDDYGVPTKITLLGSIIKSGSVYYVFKYLLPDKDEANELIGIAGPFKAGSSKLNFERYYAYTGYEVVKTNWRLQAGEMIQPLLDAYK